MTENNAPQGVVVTIREIYGIVVDIKTSFNSEMTTLRKDFNEENTKIKMQLSALWVSHGILISIIIFLATKGLNI